MGAEHRRAEPKDEGDLTRHELERRLVLEVSQAVSSTLDLEVVLQLIADGTARLVGVETSAVYVLDGDQLYLGATTPPLDPNLPESLRWATRDDHPHIDEALRSRRALLVPDAVRTELSPAERLVVDLRHLRALLFLPFFVEATPIGVLILGTNTGERVFSDHEIDLCRTLTNQLAVGVQNARLHTGLKRYAAELEQQMAAQERLAEQLRYAQKMEAIGQLAGGVAHDFNNLLQVIQGFTALARDELDPATTVHNSLGLVQQAAERAALLVRQLLAFGRRQTLSLAVVDLDQTVDGLIPMLGPVMGEHIRVERRRDTPLDAVEADASQLEQVLVNLCVNARDAMPDGGTLVVSTRNIAVDPERGRALDLPLTGRHVVLEIIDSGCGMSPETLARVFEPFFTTKGPSRGTGLGLPTVRGLVNQHRGALHIDSEVGRGTRVAVYLPAVAAATSAECLATPPPPPTGTETILVAEDDPLVLKLTRAVLEAAGYVVLSARNGEEALTLLEAGPTRLDLALLDVVMPQLGGGAVFRRLRERHPDLPVLFASGYGDRDPPFEPRHGRVALLQKPYSRDELLRRIRTLLDEPAGRR